MNGRSFTREAPGVRDDFREPTKRLVPSEEFEQTYDLDIRPAVAVIDGVVYRGDAVPDAQATWMEVYASRLVKGKVKKAW